MTGKFRFLAPPLFAAFLLAISSPTCAADVPRQIAGLVEKVLIGEPGVEFEGKLDTGAELSSIDAIEIIRESRFGRRWLSFTVVRVDGKRTKLSGPLVRYVQIKRVGGSASKRPVVRLQVCLGSVSRSVEVSLADRKGFDYDVLIGRNFLSGHFMVDPVQDHALTLACPARQPK